jgi:hypothetical protein
MRQIPLRWKLLVILSIACGLASFLAWGILLTSFCSHPRTPMLEQDIAYSCHGATVFISHLENELQHWLIPVGGLFIFLSLLAAVGALIAAGQIRIELSVNVTDHLTRAVKQAEHHMADLPPLPHTPTGHYRHYKGGEYEVIGVARHSETLEPLVVYRPLYNASGLWVRPHGMFFEQVEIAGKLQPRFTPIKAP